MSDAVIAPGQAQAASVSKADMQNIQRLLKLLADRYPKTYGSVDPGRIDGSYGDGTKDAIRNFQRISGSSSGLAQSEQLEADILAALAQMSATQTAESDTTSGPAKAPPPNPQVAAPAAAPTIDLVPSDQKAASRTDAAPTTETAVTTTPKPQPTNPETTAVSAPPAPAAPAQKDGAATAKTAPVIPAPRPTPTPVAAVKSPEPQKEPEKPVAADNKPATPALGPRIYFVQAASLRSLDSAKREWQRIFDENRAALTGEQVYFERANIANRGVFYRILIGPMAEAGSARTLCTFLKKNDQTCVVTVRKRSDLPKPGEKTGSLIPGNEKAVAAVAPVEPPAPKAPVVEQVPAQSPPAVSRPGPSTDVATNRTEDATPTTGSADKTSTTAETAIPQISAPAAPASSTTTDADRATAAVQPTEGPEPAKPERQDVATLAPPTASPSADSTPTPPVTPLQAKTPRIAAPQITPPAAAPSRDAGQATLRVETPSAPTVDFGDFQASLTPETVETVETAAVAETETDAPTASPAEQTQPPASSTAETAPPLIAIKGRGVSLQTLGITAAAILAIVAGAVIVRRRTRKTALTQLLQPGALALVPEAAGGDAADDALAALETDFDSAQLKQSRLARDEFLRDVLGEQKIEADDLTQTDDSAIRINNRLKSLLASDPAQYKSIFLNWVFLSKIGTALNDNEITLEQLNGHFGREFNILQNYFKIHLLELDDRHRIRKELPGLYYCLQLAQQKQREGGRAPSAA